MRTVPQIRAGIPADSQYVAPKWRKTVTRSLYMRWQHEAISHGDTATAKHYAKKLSALDAMPNAPKLPTTHGDGQPISDEDKRQIRDWMKRGFKQADVRRWTGNVYTKGQISGFYFKERQKQMGLAA